MKNNEHKKRTFIDEFARHFYCDHARLNKVREDKKNAKRKERRLNKKQCKNIEGD